MGKKKSKSCFDVTMGSHHSAEVCELVGILSHLTKLIDQNVVGLYTNDGLNVAKNLKWPPNIETEEESRPSIYKFWF